MVKFSSIAGLVTKPLSGILDSVSKTAEGIQQTANEEGSQNLRIRPPRAFYQLDDSLKEYSYEDAVYFRALGSREDRLVIGFGGLANGKSLVYLALTTKFMEAIDEYSKRLLVPIPEVISIQQMEKNIIKVTFSTSGGRKSLSLTAVYGEQSAYHICTELNSTLKLLKAQSS